MPKKPEEVVIHLRDDLSVLLEIKEKGTVRTKMISVDALMDCLKGSVSGFTFSTGILPENFVSVTVNTGKKQRYIVVEFQEERADITYMKTEFKNFPLPRLLFGFRIEDNGRISLVNLGVPAPGKLKPDTPMYHYPFSNVRQFAMCTGSNTLPHIKNLQQVQNLPYYIMSFPDNDDHYSDRHNKPGLCHRELMEHLQDKDRQYYYDHILVPMEGITLKDFL